MTTGTPNDGTGPQDADTLGRYAGYHLRAAFPEADARWRPYFPLLGRLLAWGWKAGIVATLPDGLILERQETWWYVADNGGELTVTRINSQENPRPDVPYGVRGGVVPMGTVAGWIVATMDNRPIDYNDRSLDDLLTDYITREA